MDPWARTRNELKRTRPHLTAPPHRYTRLARSRFLPCPSPPFASIPTNAIQRNNVRSCEKKVMRHPPCFVAKAVMLLKSVRHTYPSFAISLQSLLVSSCKARYAVDAKLALHSWPQQREERLWNLSPSRHALPYSCPSAPALVRMRAQRKAGSRAHPDSRTAP